MPTLKVNSKHIRKLKQLGVYDKWLANLKIQWDTEECWLNPANFHFTPERELNAFEDIQLLLKYSITWTVTPEGHEFWDDVYLYKL